MIQNAARVLVSILMLGVLVSSVTAYPNRPIRLVVSAPAGTAPDIIARLIAPKMSEQLGQPIIIDNKTGANGNIAAGEVSKAAADGYTLLMTVAGTITANPSLYPRSAVTDLEPITQVVTNDFIVATRASLNITTLPELLALIRNQPGKINAATTANGSFPHLAAELLKKVSGVDFTIIKHNGEAAVGTSVAGEHTDFAIVTRAVVASFVDAKKLVPIASTGPTRNVLSPDLPTVAEANLPGYAMMGWIALLGPKGLPQQMTATLHKAVSGAVSDPTIRERMSAMQFSPIVNTPADFAKVIDEERAKLSVLVQHAKLAE